MQKSDILTGQNVFQQIIYSNEHLKNNPEMISNILEIFKRHEENRIKHE